MSLTRVKRLEAKIQELKEQIRLENEKPVNPRVLTLKAMVKSDIWKLKLSYAMKERLWNAGIKNVNELKTKYDSLELLNVAGINSRQLKVIGKMLYRDPA